MQMEMKKEEERQKVVNLSATLRTFQPKLEKQKKLKKSTLKKFFIFSQKKFFSYLRKIELLYFKKWNFLATSLKNSYFSKNGFSHISRGNLQSPGIKNFLYFGKWNFLAPRLKKFLYFSKKKFCI